MKANRERVLSCFYPAFIFALNIFITWRYLRSGFLDQLPSIEGAFVSLARYIQHHWPVYDWLPIWYSGLPFSQAYQPALHYAVAAFAAVSGLTPPSAYHFVTAVTYSLAGVGFYFLAKSLGTRSAVAFGGALLFSVFSPSLLLVGRVRADAGGLWHARRLQAMVQYGEGPNSTGLMLGLFALGLLYRALTRKSAGSAVAAALAIAAVPATNWPATVALCTGIVSCLVAFSFSEIRRFAGRLCAIGGLAVCFALPFALPSSVLSTFRNANVMSDAPTAGVKRWATAMGLLLLVAIVRWVLRRMGAGYAARFSSTWLIILGGIVLSTDNLHVNLVPQPMRFHVALEIPMILTVTLLGGAALNRWPRLSIPLGLAVLVFCGFQTYHFRQHARTMARRIDITKTLEYQEAEWFARNTPGQRVAVPGSVSFWLNAFGDTPQLTGCCEQATVNPVNFITGYIVGAGYRSDAESADITLLWLKAWAVQAFGAGGPHSREAYKAFQFPGRFRDSLPVVWQNGDDAIYRIPERAPGLARAVRANDLVKHTPENGIDVKELRAFVAALDDANLPVVSFEWQGANAARIHGPLQPDDVVSVAVNYAPGWTAAVAGKPVKVRPDGMGLIVVEPGCSGDCTIDLRWSAGTEPWLACGAALLALAAGFVWWNRSLRQPA